MYSLTCDELVERLGQLTTITLKSSNTLQGYLYTIDPTSHHVVLYNQEQEKVQLVMHSTIDTITFDSTQCIDVDMMDKALKYCSENKYTPEWINKRKLELIEFFQQNRIPIQFNENEPVIHVLGSARVVSPYVATSVVCDNALIRKRVRDLILQLEKK